MGVSKVVFAGQTLVDLTSDTVSANTLAEGVTAHDAAGNSIAGTFVAGSKTLLWENANPSVAFVAQTVQIGVDLGQYDFILIIMTGVNYNDTSLLVEPGNPFAFSIAMFSSAVTSAYTSNVIRTGEVLSNGVKFNACAAGFDGNWNFNQNVRLIPKKIYGIKL